MATQNRWRKVLLRTFGCLLAVVGVLALALWLFARTWRQEIATYSFAPDVEIRFWIESDVDHGPSVFYEVHRGSRVVTPYTYLGWVEPDRDLLRGLRRASSEDGSVVALWWPPDGVAMLFHFPSDESYPRPADHESLSQPAVLAKWRQRADPVRVHHPDFPVPPLLGPPDDGDGEGGG